MAKKTAHNLLKTLLLIANIFAVIALLLSYLAPFISPEKFWPIAFFGLAYPILLVLNIFFVILWIILWKKYVLISLITILAGYQMLFNMIAINFNDEAPPAGSVKILTFNVHSLYGVAGNKGKGTTHSEVTDFIAGAEPDIACIQEFLARDRDSLAILPKFGEAIGLPYFTYKNYYPIKDGRKVNALAIFSRYEVVSTGSLRINKMNVFAVYADLLMGDEIIRVYNLHLRSINLGADDYNFYSKITEPDSEDENPVPLKEGSLKIIQKLKFAFIVRARQVDILTSHIRQSPYPVIICGDFNDSPASYTYRKLAANMQDSFKKAAKGAFGNTYAGKFPSYRIDYILHNPFFRAYRYKRYEIDISDHYPVSVYLKRSGQ